MAQPRSKPPTLVDPQAIAAIFVELGTYERHFNEQQSRYRTLASTWLLATFAATGFILSTQALELPFDRMFAVVGVGIAGSVGISLLWVLDLLVYQRLLGAVFVEGFKFEDRYPELPQIREAMWQSQEDRGRSRGALPRLAWFYVVTTNAPLAVSTAALILYLKRFQAVFPIGAGVAAVGTMLLVGLAIRRFTLEPREAFKSIAERPATEFDSQSIT